MAYFLPPIVSDNPVTRPELPSFSFKSQTPKNKNHKVGRSHSLGNWWKKNMRPSERPEQGGTIREHVLLANDDSDASNVKRPLRRATDARRSRRSGTADSDTLTRWNTPKNLSEDREYTSPLPQRAFSGGVKQMPLSASDRKWSWAPRDDYSQQTQTQHAETKDLKVSWQDAELIDDLEGGPSQSRSAADRRLSNFRRDVEAKKERRRQRKSLKESGDFLGVQGINPETGQLDIITPSGSDNSAADPETEQKIRALRQALKNARDTYKDTAEKSEREVKRLLLKKEKDRLDKRQLEKDALSFQFQGPRWRRHTKQWSSAQEPELSPIPQSLRSGTSTSRRPSQPAFEAEKQAPLINLNSPPKLVLPTDNVEDHSMAEISGLTSRSSNTVIRTPHRRSLAVGKSAAQELFDNGISFNDLDPLDKSNEAPEEAKTGLWTPTHGSGTPSKASGVLSDQPDKKSDAPRHLLKKIASDDSKTYQKGPFLDIPALGEAGSQGPGSKALPRPLSMGNLLKRDKLLTPTRSFSLLPKRHQNEKFLNQMSMSDGTSEPDPLLTPTNLLLRASPKEPAQLFKEPDRSSQGSPLRRISPKQFLLNLKKKKRMRRDHHQDRIEQVILSQELKSVTNLPQTQDGTITPMGNIMQTKREAHPAQDLKGRQSNRVAGDMQRDTENLRRKEGRTGQYHSTIEPEPHHLPTDHDWIEGTIRGITEKGDEIMKTPMSTLTTTTTGFDRQTFGSNPNQESSEAKEITGRDQTRSHYHFEKQAGAEKEARSKNYLQKRPQSSLLRLTPEWQIVPNDITSTDSQDTMSCEGGTRHHQQITPSTSTSLQGSLQDVPSRCPVLREDRQEKKGFTKMARKIVTSIPTKGPGYYAQTAENGNQDHIQAREKSQKSPIPHIERLGKTDQASTLMKTCPGAFPQRPGAEEDIADPSEERLSRVMKENHRRLIANDVRSIWNTAKETIFVARCHLAVFIRLYWGLTQPVFDRSSEYWMRNARGDATLKDGVTFVLALPGAILGLFAFI